VTAEDICPSPRPAALKIAEALAPTSMIVLPLVVGPRALGAVSLVKSEGSPAFIDKDLVTLERFAAQLAGLAEANRLRTALKAAERRADDFLSKLVHELRNPLAPLKHAVQILRIKGNEAETRAWAQEMMERQVGQLVSSIERCIGASLEIEAQPEPAALEAQASVAPAPPSATPSVPSKRRRVLVVDDNQDVAQSLAMVVDLCGHDVEVAHDGPAALSKAKAAPPDVVFLDIGLPGMDGYEVARAMRAEAKLNQAVLVALTGYGTEEAKRKSAEAGFNHHLLKPVSLELVESLLVFDQ
jgi:CheY-like chemotaxis protein